MRPGSVIVDMAAATGGNCPLTEAEKVVIKHGVTIVGITNFPALVPPMPVIFILKIWSIIGFDLDRKGKRTSSRA